MYRFTISVTNLWAVAAKYIEPKNVNSGLLSTFSSLLASVGFRKAKSSYSIQRKCTGNYNPVALINKGAILYYKFF